MLGIRLLEFYSYRKAFLQAPDVVLPWEAVADLREELAAQSNNYAGNHTCYTFIAQGKRQAVMFSDGEASFGPISKLKIGGW